jgi:hypothetical protein
VGLGDFDTPRSRQAQMHGNLHVLVEIAGNGVRELHVAERWLSECRLANISPGQVTPGTRIHKALQVVRPPLHQGARRSTEQWLLQRFPQPTSQGQ